MRPDLDSPQFWKSLYKRPAESSTQGVEAGSADLEEGDLEAWLDPDAMHHAESGSTGVDSAAVMEMVEALVEKRIQALMAQGWGPNAGGAGPAQAPPQRPAQPRAPQKMAPPPPPPRPAPRPQAAPRPQRPAPAPAKPAPAPRPAPQQARPAPKPRPAPAPPAAAGRPSTKGGAKVGAAMWERIPTLPNGQASLFQAGDLGNDAIQLLVMVDGSTSLRGLRTLVPHMDDQTFLGHIRAAIKKGILDLT